ncbi:MAG: tocopherol cyclase family protein [Bacillota bacterium]|nr:tocopherol cyclase family protein [Bacillota bacterium]
MLRQIINPDLYHGNHRRDTFFEGWYFKISTRDGSVFSFIPGVSISREPGGTFSFIQILKGNQPEMIFIKFPFEAFAASNKSFNIGISHNSFSLNAMYLDIEHDNNVIKGYLKFIEIKKWPDSILNPGSMGFYNYLPFMECYSQVCALTGRLDGNLFIDGTSYDFNGGSIYIEKNWGNSFPFSYIWAQCNSFHEPDHSVTCSIGHIPMPTGSFTGFLIGLSSKGRFYKFTTINKSRLFLDFVGNSMLVHASNRMHELSLRCTYDMNKFVLLYAPEYGTMVPMAEESLLGGIELQLREKRTGKVLLADSGICAGIEFRGDYRHLCSTSPAFKQ